MALDDPRRKNLRPPVRPGDPPRNPLGKNGSEWLKAFRDFFEEIPGEKLPKGAPRVEPGDNRHLIAIRALFRNMIIGSDASLKLGIEQLQGRARQHIEVSGDLGNGPPVTFLIPENGRDVAHEDPEPVDGKPDDPPADE